MYSAIGGAQSVKLGLASNPESSSSWVKTIIDPAHAREYSCRGIPDENQDPTLVYYGRDTLTLTTEYFGSLTGSTYIYESGAWTASTAATRHVFSDVYVIQTGLVVNNIVLVAVGTCTKSTETRYPVLVYKVITDSTGVGVDDTVRLVAQSLTVGWGGKELNRGGLFEGGYLPFSQTSVDRQSNVTGTLSLDDFPNYATYNAGSADGCYIIGRFNQYDMYKWWKAQGNTQLGLLVNNSFAKVGTALDYVAPVHWGAWRPSVVRYITNGEKDWLLRVTYNTVVELMKPYNAGGTDGALYDMASVQDVIAIYDSMDLIFPSRFNDFKKVWSWIKANGPKAAGVAASLLRHFPRTRKLAMALDILIGRVPYDLAGVQRNVVVKAAPPPLLLTNGPSKKRKRRKKGKK